jgi:hypothetical protein
MAEIHGGDVYAGIAGRAKRTESPKTARGLFFRVLWKSGEKPR